MIRLKILNIQNGKDVRVNADLEFSAFPFLLQLMLDQTSSILIDCLTISQKLRTKVAQMSKHVAGRFDFLQTEFEMSLAKKSN